MNSQLNNILHIDKNYFEHLLNCLANQKFMPVPDKQSKDESKRQKIIDEAYIKGRNILSFH